MPRVGKTETMARQWELMKLLPCRRPGKSVREIVESLAVLGHPVSKRTVERDLLELTSIFPIECNDISQPYGWHLIPGAKFDVPGIDLTEAVSLGLLEDVLTQLVPDGLLQSLEGRFEQAEDKLRSLTRNARAKWKDLVRYVPPGLTFLPPNIDREVLNDVHDGLTMGRQLLVNYTSSEEQASKELVLHPLALIQQGVRAYLVATTFDFPTPLYYALHRMSDAELMDEPAKRPPGFSLDEFMAQGGGQFGDGKKIKLRATVSDHLAALLRETPIAMDQKITTRAGANTLTATVVDSWQLLFWVLSQGPNVVVKNPVSLRRSVIEQHSEALRAYSEE